MRKQNILSLFQTTLSYPNWKKSIHKYTEQKKKKKVSTFVIATIS